MSHLESFRHTGNPAIYLIAKAHGDNLTTLVEDLKWLLIEQMLYYEFIGHRDQLITLGALCTAEGLRHQEFP